MHNSIDNTFAITLFGHGSLAVAVLEHLRTEGFKVKWVNDSEGDDGILTQRCKELSVLCYSLHPRREKAEILANTDTFDSVTNVLLSVNFRYIISNSILERYKWSLNVHGSLLPKYRGRAPHVWAIIHGERETGVTVHLMDEGVDTGPIVEQRAIPISGEYSGADVLREYHTVYPDAVISSLQKLLSGHEPDVQDETLATYFGKRTPDMGIIDFRMPAHDISNFIRALRPPYPGAYTYLLNGRKLIVESMSLRADLERLQLPKYSPREVDGAILVRLDEGVYELREHIKESL